MLAILFCLTGVFILLLLAETFDQQKILQHDHKRQFIHMTVGSFVAFWPWLISWRTIELIGLAMLTVVILNQRHRIIDFHSNIKRRSYGDVFYALAVVLSAILTHQKVFFALAILIMAVGDGLSNLIGHKYGQKWRYAIFGHIKSVIGSMTLWFVSLCILGVGLLFAPDAIDFSAYVVLLLVLPPILFIIENGAVYGSDNIIVPLVVLLALSLAK